MDGSFDLNIGTYLISIASKSVYKVQCRDSISWYCYSAVSSAYGMCLMLRYHYNTRSILLSDIFASDYLGCNMRFLISYNVYSLLYNIRLLLSVFINDLESIMSLTKIYPCANWFEREIYDMFGVKFNGHTDLRRILTDYGFNWHPLRKDFPLTGYVEYHYNEQYKCVMSNDVNMIQECRVWFFEHQWAFHLVDYIPNDVTSLA